MSKPNPWGYARPDLSEVNLTTAEKSWLGWRVSKDKANVKKLAKRFNLKPKTLQKYGKCYLAHNAVREGGGKPSVLEEEDLEALREFVGTGRMSKSVKEVKAEICRLAQLRSIKRGLFGPQTKPPSDRTMRRYMQVY